MREIWNAASWFGQKNMQNGLKCEFYMLKTSLYVPFMPSYNEKCKWTIVNCRSLRKWKHSIKRNEMKWKRKVSLQHLNAQIIVIKPLQSNNNWSAHIESIRDQLCGQWRRERERKLMCIFLDWLCFILVHCSVRF